MERAMDLFRFPELHEAELLFRGRSVFRQLPLNEQLRVDEREWSVYLLMLPISSSSRRIEVDFTDPKHWCAVLVHDHTPERPMCPEELPSKRPQEPTFLFRDISKDIPVFVV